MPRNPADTVETPGARALKAFLSDRGISQTDCANALCVTDTALSLWLSFRRRPDPVLRRRIARWTNGQIGIAAWETAEETQSVDLIQPLSAA
jgi:transcriptional regulator with XRE-family HTH domain